jgi:shikimate dehydrogenase
MNAVYTRLAAGSAEDAVRTARAMKLAGINVTSPFKEEIMDFLDGADVHAAKIGAVNCVVPRKTRLWGCNTDYLGAVRALTRNGVDPRGKNIAILGAGGAARSAAYGLMRRRAARVTILNRTEERARNAARAFGCDSAPLERADDVIRKSDILISCISSRATSHETYLRNKKLVVLQADYRDSPLLTGRSRRKYPLIGGQEWLIAQAVPAFRHFTGRTLSTRLERMARAMDLSTRPAGKPNIALVGFMGSGKTATGRVLARKMGWGLVDTDAEIGKRSGMSVPKMFTSRGEPFFREMEKSLIARLVPSAKGKIFSLGGGAVLDEDTRALLTHHCQVIWLWTTLETALARIDLPSRPVLHAAGGERPIERAYQARFRACALASDLVLATDGPTPEETGERIRYEMDQAFED